MTRPREFNEDEALQKATMVFWKHGFQGATPRALMEAMELSKSSLYGTFGNKRELFVRCLKHYSNQLTAIIESNLAKDDFKKALTAVGEVVIEAACKRRTGCFLYNTASELSPHDSQIERIVKAAIRRNEKVYVNRIVRAQNDGHATKELNPKTTAQYLLACFAGIQVMGKAKASPAELRQVVQQTIDLIR